MKILFKDPADVLKLSKEELADMLERTESLMEEAASQRIVIREEILHKIETDGEVINNKAFSKIKIYNFDIELEKAKELGATKVVPEKETIDNPALKRLLASGVKIKHEVVDRLLVREIKK